MKTKIGEEILIHEPGQWENEDGPIGWYAVSNEDGIFAYASTLEVAQDIKTSIDHKNIKDLSNGIEFDDGLDDCGLVDCPDCFGELDDPECLTCNNEWKI